MLRSFRRHLFGISPKEVEFGRRGFHAASDEARQRLETAGGAFVTGYNAGLACDDAEQLGRQLGAVQQELAGFAFEGAAMALSLLDQLTPWRRNRWRTFLNGPGEPHVYMVHVGAGWALARLRRRVDRPLARLDPLLRWLTVDGYGFHQGFFSPRRYADGQECPPRLAGYARRAFDQGLGRCLWFVQGADVEVIPGAIARFEPSRRGDLWSGLGLACAYAGGVGGAGIEALRDAATGFGAQLAQGASFAAKVRQRAGNPASHTDLACELFCGTPALEAARVTDDTLAGVADDGPQPGFEVWRQRIQQHYADGMTG